MLKSFREHETRYIVKLKKHLNTLNLNCWTWIKSFCVWVRIEAKEEHSNKLVWFQRNMVKHKFREQSKEFKWNSNDKLLVRKNCKKGEKYIVMLKISTLNIFLSKIVQKRVSGYKKNRHHILLWLYLPLNLISLRVLRHYLFPSVVCMVWLKSIAQNSSLLLNSYSFFFS